MVSSGRDKNIRQIPLAVRLVTISIFAALGFPACRLASVACLSSDPGCDPAIFFLRASGAGVSDVPGFFGTGRDGAFTAAAASTVINAASEITTVNTTSGSTTITVASAAGFQVNDLVLVIQMQGGSGNFPKEFTTITSIVGNNLTVSPALLNAYSSNGFNQPNTTPANVRASQVIRVPQYTDVTVNAGASIEPASAWNGNTGGVVVFRASGTVTINGSINVRGMGFRPGTSSLTLSTTSPQGESRRGLGVPSVVENNGAGSGATNVAACSVANGGVAAHASAVTGTGIGGFCCGSTGSSPGTPTGVASLSDFAFGPGGGGSAWAACNGAGIPFPGAGGGIIIIDANSIVVNSGGSVNAGGADGVINAGVDYGAAGAGGSIYLRGNSVSIGTSLVTTTGGSSPDISSIAGSGPIRIDSRTLSGSSSPAAGYGSTVVTTKSPLEQ